MGELPWLHTIHLHMRRRGSVGFGRGPRRFGVMCRDDRLSERVRCRAHQRFGRLEGARVGDCQPERVGRRPDVRHADRRDWRVELLLGDHLGALERVHEAGRLEVELHVRLNGPDVLRVHRRRRLWQAADGLYADVHRLRQLLDRQRRRRFAWRRGQRWRRRCTLRPRLRMDRRGRRGNRQCHSRSDRRLRHRVLRRLLCRRWTRARLRLWHNPLNRQLRRRRLLWRRGGRLRGRQWRHLRRLRWRRRWLWLGGLRYDGLRRNGGRRRPSLLLLRRR